MARPHIAASLRALVFERANGRCEYCCIHQDDVATRHPIDHVIPLVHGGATTESNLALACSQCNITKGGNLSSIDPLTGEIVDLFNPRTQQWSQHFALVGAGIVGLTATGRATVRLFRLNDTRRVEERAWLQGIGRYPTV